MASTTPLLSAWKSRQGPAPWWLYAASNAASLAALLAYPFAIAPALPLSLQRALLPALLVPYGLALTWIAARSGRDPAPSPAAEHSGGSLTHRRQAIWFLGAAAPAGLLAATTNFIQTDLVAAPSIWIGPLSVYLASFVVAFSERGRRALPMAERLAPAAAVLLWVPFVEPYWPVLPLLLTELGALFVLCLAIHGRLARDTPPEAHLDPVLSPDLVGWNGGDGVRRARGAGRLFADLRVPDPDRGWSGCAGAAPGNGFGAGARAEAEPRRSGARVLIELAWRVAPVVLVAVLLRAQVSAGAVHPAVGARLLRLLFLGAAVAAVAVTAPVNAAVTPIAMLGLIAFNRTDPLVRERTFFGVIEVVASENIRREYSGTTLHGAQATDERRTEPTMYYAKVGPLGAIFDDLRRRAVTPSIGVVGLGVGTVAAYAQPGDRLAFFEIDRAVIDVAANPAYFTYLIDAPVVPRVVAGDGRLSLMSEPAASLDLLLLDAFTSDVVPAHLLTLEALLVYTRTLRPGGLLAFHLTSRFYYLPAAVGATARSLGLAAARQRVVPSKAEAARVGAAAATWLVVGAEVDVARFMSSGWTAVSPGGTVLTDDYSDLTRLLILGGG